MPPNAEAPVVARPILALDGLCDKMAQDPSFHPDYSTLFRRAIEERRKGARGMAVPYNGLDQQEERNLSALYDSLLDNPGLHPDYSQLFTKALTERRDGKPSPMLLQYGKQYKPDTPQKKVDLYLPEEPKKKNGLARLLSIGKRRFVCGATGWVHRQPAVRGEREGPKARQSCPGTPKLRGRWITRRGRSREEPSRNAPGEEPSGEGPSGKELSGEGPSGGAACGEGLTGEESSGAQKQA